MYDNTFSKEVQRTSPPRRRSGCGLTTVSACTGRRVRFVPSLPWIRSRIGVGARRDRRGSHARGRRPTPARTMRSVFSLACGAAPVWRSLSEIYILLFYTLYGFCDSAYNIIYIYKKLHRPNEESIECLWWDLPTHIFIL